MPKVSVIIPSRNEIFLPPTIDSLIDAAAGDIEIIAVLDGYLPDPPLKNDPRLIPLHFPSPQGMRAAINVAAAKASGEYLMKTDAHCLFAPGFDQVLAQNHLEDNWIQIPRRYSLDAESWKIDAGRPYRDYHYLCYPQNGKPHDDGMHGVEWPQRTRERSDPKYDIDDTMGMQGSCWFMTKNHFDNFLHSLNESWGNIAQEGEEISNKTWLGGGRLVANKKTWYAHLHKGRRWGRMYHLNEKAEIASHNRLAEYWMHNRWEGRIHDIDWLVEKFWPVPTWPQNWKELYYSEN